MKMRCFSVEYCHTLPNNENEWKQVVVVAPDMLAATLSLQKAPNTRIVCIKELGDGQECIIADRQGKVLEVEG